MLNFLTGDSPVNVAQSVGVQPVSTQQVTNKVNGIFGHIHQLLTGTFGNLAYVFLLIGIIMLVVSAVFFKKGMKGAALSILGVLLGIILFVNAQTIVGWVIGMAK